MPIDKHIINANLEAEGVVNAQLDKSGYTEDETSVMAGKAAIAASITNKGVTASKNDSFHQLSNKIDNIITGGGSSEILQSKIITGFNGIYSDISFFPNSIITAEAFDPPKLPALFDEYYNALPSTVKSANMSDGGKTVADWYNYCKDKCPFILFINGTSSATFILKYNREVSTTMLGDCISYTDATDPSKVSVNFNPYRTWFNVKSDYSRWSSACFYNFDPRSYFDSSSSSAMNAPYIDGVVWRFDKNNSSKLWMEALAGNIYGSPYGGTKINNTYGYAYNNNYYMPEYYYDNSWVEDWVKISDIYSSHSEGILLAFGSWFNSSSNNNGFMITKAYE